MDVQSVDDVSMKSTTSISRFHPPYRLQHHLNITTQGRPADISDEHPQPSESRGFNLLYLLLRIPEIGLEVARYMDAASILTLYAISSPFHVLVNTHMHAVVRASALHAFPWSTTAFPFAMMRSLCVPDPAADRHALGLRTVQPRLVPGLRWLAMAYFRCGVADGIWAALRDRGHRLPRGVAAPAACHLWFTMAMPANAQRLGLLRSKHYWSDAVLRAAVLLMVKLDMAMTDPVDGSGVCELRHLMLSQRSLVPLLRLIIGNMSLLELHMYKVRWDYVVPTDLAPMGYSVLGVPAQHVGRGHLQYFGRGLGRALTVNSGVMMEAERRGLKIHEDIVDMITAGFREDTNNIAAAELDDDEIGSILEDWKSKMWFK